MPHVSADTPIQPAPIAPRIRRAHTGHMMDGSESGHILRVYVVEDSMAICERIVRLVCEIDGMSVVGTANNASSAIAGITSSAPHAVILDIRLADSSGFTVMEVIAQKIPRPKVMVLTNFISEPYRKLAHERGADAFLDKSNDFLRIPKILRAWRQSPLDRPRTAH